MPGNDGEVRRGWQTVEDEGFFFLLFYSPEQGILNSNAGPVSVQSFLAGAFQTYKVKG